MFETLVRINNKVQAVPMKKVGQQLKKCMDQVALPNAGIASLLDITPRTLNNYVNGTRTPSIDFLVHFSDVFRISLDELIAGKEQKYVSYAQRKIPLDDETLSDEFQAIPMYDVDLAAGGGSINSDKESIGDLLFRADWLRQIGVNSGAASLVRVKGDSMEPTLRDKSLVLLDHYRRTVKSSNIYAFEEDGAAFVKRLERINKDTLLILSDNPNAQNRVLRGEDIKTIRIIGQVVWSAFTWGPKVPNAFG